MRWKSLLAILLPMYLPADDRQGGRQTDSQTYRQTDGRTEEMHRSIGWFVWQMSRGDPMVAEGTVFSLGLSRTLLIR